jgi:hypothetical protein
LIFDNDPCLILIIAAPTFPHINLRRPKIANRHDEPNCRIAVPSGYSASGRSHAHPNDERARENTQKEPQND